MLETIREHSQSQHFSLRHGFISGSPIGKNSGQFGDFGNPAPVFFLLVLNGEGRHRHDSTLGLKLTPNVRVQQLLKAVRWNEGLGVIAGGNHES